VSIHVYDQFNETNGQRYYARSVICTVYNDVAWYCSLEDKIQNKRNPIRFMRPADLEWLVSSYTWVYAKPARGRIRYLFFEKVLWAEAVRLAHT
jgi:hypothetical protein